MMLPVERTREFFERVELPRPLDDAAELVLGEIRTRLSYLCDVGLRYLTLDRQSRTLSGGVAFRIGVTALLSGAKRMLKYHSSRMLNGLTPRLIGWSASVLKSATQCGLVEKPVS